MAILRDPNTNFILGDPDSTPFSGDDSSQMPDDSEIQDALSSMILSASGWRTIFAPDGEEGSGTIPPPAKRVLAVAMGAVFADWLIPVLEKKSPCVLVGMDTRPTGPAIAELLIRALIAKGCRVRYAFIAAAPEIMARAGNDSEIDAFAYISASHNPIGHNGIKFGIGGGVLGGDDAKKLISLYRQTIAAPGAAGRLVSLANSSRSNPEYSHTLRSIYNSVPSEKKLSLEIYQEFLNQIAGGPGNQAERENTRKTLAAGLAQRPITIIADLNGSARTLSVDQSYLKELGATLESFNDKPRQIVHAIIPEGASLEPCRIALEEARSKNPSAILGYVPDCDGDRGNLVIWDEKRNAARTLEAQEVFALSVLAELSCAAWSQTGSDETTGSAIVVNGPTSLRVHAIADAYSADVYEAEVGEANVVNRASELRAAGYQVRLLGEGSNGGTITHPAAVRDPLNTVTALIKLLRIPSTNQKPGPFEDWCRRIGRPDAYQEDFGPSDILATLPRFATTPASAERAIMRIKSSNHGALKESWETLFLMEWSRQAGRLEEAYGFHSWEAINNEGTVSRLGLGPGSRSGAQTGGLKILFRDIHDNPAGFLWMRGSGTEPVFRVMAEIRGDNTKGESALIEWHRSLVAEADRRACVQTDSETGNTRLNSSTESDAFPDPVAV